MAIQFIIDAGCDLNKDQANALGVILVPMTIRFGDEEYLSGVDITNEEFYQKLVNAKASPTTSQPSPYDFEKVYQKVLEQGDEAVVLCLSSALSGTYQSATIAADGFEDRIHVIDTRAVSLAQKILLDYALSLRDQGLSAKEIAEKLEVKKQDVRAYGAVETLEYLIRGGRLSKAAGAVGSVLGIRPVLFLSDGALAVAGKVRGPKAAITLTHNLMAEDGIDYSMPFMVGYTGNDPSVIDPFLQSPNSVFGGYDVPVCNVGSTVGTHTGPGLFLAAFFHKS